jgi:hypothetical protein
MRTAVVTLVGISPYSQSKPHGIPKDDKESNDDHDLRTWREKAHSHVETGEVYMPPMGLKLAIAEAAKRLAIKIPGKGKQTYTKNILSGVLIPAEINLGIKVDDLRCETVYVNSDGRRGSGSRVFRRFPMIPAGWTAKADVVVLDDEIPAEVIERCIVEAGDLIGVGRFRPQNGGYLGRFAVKSIKWDTAARERRAA